MSLFGRDCLKVSLRGLNIAELKCLGQCLKLLIGAVLASVLISVSMSSIRLEECPLRSWEISTFMLGPTSERTELFRFVDKPSEMLCSIVHRLLLMKIDGGHPPRVVSSFSLILCVSNNRDKYMGIVRRYYSVKILTLGS